MGVRGLTTYVKCNEDIFLKYHLLHDTNLIIDGNSLCCQLLAQMNGFWAFGGDYDKYSVTIKRFFQSLRKCNIKSYVLFDGCYENRKLRTAYSRLRSKLYGASKLDPVTQCSLQIFPLLFQNVFREVLRSLDIPYTICEFEADEEIAAMARHLECPVLSYDSDYFIFNVVYIPFKTLTLSPKTFEDNDNKFFALQCKIYKVEYLLRHFGGLKPELLPLLATLLGNDFVEKRVFKKFYSQLKLPNTKKKMNDQQRCIRALLKWLEHESLDSAVAKILGRLKKNEKHKVYYIIKQSIDGYNRHDCKSLQYFDILCEKVVQHESMLNIPIDVADSQDKSSHSDEILVNESDDLQESDSSETSDAKSDEENGNLCLEGNLPNWVSICIRKELIPQQYLNLCIHHLYLCSPQAEDFTDDDAFLCVLSLVKYAFDILTNFSDQNFIYLCRNGQNYKRIVIGDDYSICKPLKLSSENLLENDLLLDYFEHFLNEAFPSLSLCALDVLPDNFQLYLLAILWWITKCDVSISYVHSLLLCYIMLEVIDEKTGMFRGHHFFNNKHSTKLKELHTRFMSTEIPLEEDDLLLNKNKVLYEDCLIAASVLLKHFELSDEIRKRPKSYDTKKVQKFAQFQCCIQQFNCLNTLCKKKYQSTIYSKSYNGTFVYNTCTVLQKHPDSLQFIDTYLKGAHTVLLYFKSLLNVFDKCVEQLGILVPKCSFSGKKRKHRKKNGNSMQFLSEEFQSEVFI